MLAFDSSQINCYFMQEETFLDPCFLFGSKFPIYLTWNQACMKLKQFKILSHPKNKLFLEINFSQMTFFGLQSGYMISLLMNSVTHAFIGQCKNSHKEVHFLNVCLIGSGFLALKIFTLCFDVIFGYEWLYFDIVA